MLVKAEGSLSGYMELSYETGKLEFSEGGAVLGIKLSSTLSSRIPAFPAAYATLKFTLSAEDKIVVSKGDSKPINLDMQFKAGLGAAVGLGLGKNTGVYQAYVEGGFEGELEMMATTAGLRTAGTDPLSVTLTGSVYVEYKAKGLILSVGDKHKWQLVKFGIYPRLELLSAYDDGIITMEDFLNEATPISRAYLTDALSRTSLFAVTDDYSYSQENLYPYCEPTLFVLPNGELLMVWVDDLGNKADNERTTLVYSVYSNGAWSSETPIHENGSYNDHPTLCQHGNSVYLIWMRADSPIQSGWNDITMLEHMELCYSVYDMSTKTFSEPTVISDTQNTLIETDYSIAASDSEIAVAWIENSENDLFMSSGTNTIYLRTCTNGAWGDIQTLFSTNQQIAGLNVQENASGWSVVYTLYDISTQNTITYQIGKGDASATLLDGVTESIIQVDGHTYYLVESELYCDGSSIGLSGVTNFDVVTGTSGTVVLSLVPTGFTCEMYASYYDAGSRTWGDWIQMTSFGKYIRNYSAALDEDGELVVAMNLVDVDTETEGSVFGNATLVVVEDLEYRDLVIGDTIFYEDNNVIPGGNLELSFEVTNNSRETLQGVTLTKSANSTQTTETLSCSIAPGATETISTTYTLPDNLNRFSIRITATPSYTGTESRTDNNSASVDIGLADLILEASAPQKNSGEWFVNLTVSNAGYAAAEAGKITVYGGNASGEILATLQVDALDIGDSQIITYALPEAYTQVQVVDTMNALNFVLNSATEERDLSNNEDRIVFDSLINSSNWQVTKGEGPVIDVQCSNANAGGQFLFATYDRAGRFLDVEMKDAVVGNTQFTVTDQNAASATVFWVDNDYRPLEACIRFTL